MEIGKERKNEFWYLIRMMETNLKGFLVLKFIKSCFKHFSLSMLHMD